MFKFLFGESVKKLEKKYALKMEKAMLAQRSGDMALFAKLSAEAESIIKEIDKLNEKKAS